MIKYGADVVVVVGNVFVVTADVIFTDVHFGNRLSEQVVDITT